MVEFNDTPGSDYEAPPKQRPVGVIAAIITFVLLTLAGLWVVSEKKSDKVRQDAVAALDQELATRAEAMKMQKEKLIELSGQLESMKAGMHSGKKTSVAEYNKVAAQQRAERETYTKMAEEYNQKVSEFKKLDQ